MSETTPEVDVDAVEDVIESADVTASETSDDVLGDEQVTER